MRKTETKSLGIQYSKWGRR